MTIARANGRAAEVSAADRHVRLTGKAVASLGKLLTRAASDGLCGTVAVEVDLRHGLAQVVRQKTTATEI